VYVTNHPFLNTLWSFFLIFLWVAWFWILITITIDIFRRRDISGWGKALWLIFVIFLPVLGVLIYLITQGSSMANRNVQEASERRQEFDTYVRETASSGPAAEIEKAQSLLASGAITQAEFDQLKAKALAAS
jgi:predicted PurR-regulated permease PerM